MTHGDHFRTNDKMLGKLGATWLDDGSIQINIQIGADPRREPVRSRLLISSASVTSDSPRRFRTLLIDGLGKVASHAAKEALDGQER